MPNPVNDWINAFMQSWSSDHPLSAWLITHPLIALGLLVAGLMVFAGLFGVVGHLTENLWLALFQVPLKLLQVLFQPLGQGLQQLFRRSLPTENKDNQIQTIIKELEALRQQEAQLLLKLQKLVQK